MMVANGALALVVLTATLKMFGVNESIIPILPGDMAVPAHLRLTMPWGLVWPMLPGAAVAFGCLWYWLTVIGRSRGIPWGGAAVYGLVIALVNVPVGGMLLGLLDGQPLWGMLILAVLLLIVPGWLLAISVFGIVMGILNGFVSQWWIGKRRS
jgi:hypothetical protein